MGTISDKLTYLNTTKSQLKDMINNGLPTEQQINSSTTFREYVTSIFNAFLEALRTPDTLFTNLPKKSGTGANITLNDTANAPMRITLGSRTLEQETTTGKNLLLTTNSNVTNGTYVSGANTNQYKIQATGTDLYVNNVSSAGGNYSINNGNKISCNYGETIYYDTGNTLFNRIYVTEWNSSNVSLGYYYKQANSSTGTHTPTNSTCSYITLRFGNSSATSSTTYTLAPMVSKSSITDYEPYTGGIASPNPSYPQDIHTISGSNTIKVEGKNLFEPTANSQTLASGGTLTKNEDNTYTVSNGRIDFADLVVLGTINVENGKTYYLYNAFSDANNNLSLRRGSTMIVATSTNNVVSYTATATETLNVYIRYQSTSTFTFTPMVAYSSPTSYTPYTLETADVDLDEYECGSIGNYENIPIRTFGKNLFDISTITQGKYIDGIGGLIDTANSNTSDWIEVKANQKFTLSWNYTEPLNSPAQREIVLYNKNKQFVETITLVPMTNKTKTFTISQDGYIRFDYDKKCYDIMLNEGETALPYEPYGNGTWYLKQEIGKVVLDGSEDENWSVDNTNQRAIYSGISSNIVKPATEGTALTGFCNNLQILSFQSVYNQKNQGLSCSSGGNLTLHVNGVTDTGNMTTSTWNTWLGSNNVTLYYQLSTPTYTPITGTLAEQLENVYQKMLSQKGVTNISQINDDLSFNLSVQALEDLEV